MRCLGAAVALGLLLIASQVRAQSGSATGVRLSFVRTSSAQDCMTASNLERELIARMGYDPFTGPPRQWIEATVAQHGNSFEVELFERDSAGSTLGTRVLLEKGPDCHKLDDAIVLAIALIIDPTVHWAPATHSAPVADAAATVNAQQTRAAPESAARAAPPANHDASPPLVLADATAHRRLAPQVSLDAVIVSGVMPGVAPGVQAVTQVPFSAQSPVALRLSTLYLPEKSQANGAGDLSYGLTAFEVGLCDTVGRRSVSWFGCLALGLGSVHTVVHNPDPLDPGDRWWGHLRAEVGIAARIAGPVWLESRLFDLVAFKRWQFRVNVNGTPEPAYEQKWFMPGASLGLGLHFD
jgi:hypothetical protein